MKTHLEITAGLWLLLVAGWITGCAGGPVHLAGRFRPDPAVSWVFDAGDTLGWGFGIYPTMGATRVCGGACVDDRVIILCNLGGATEVFKPSYAYVLGLKEGGIRQRLRGPTRTQNGMWLVSPQRAFFRREAEDRWYAFDFDTSRVLRDVGEPPSSKVIARSELLGAGLAPCKEVRAGAEIQEIHCTIDSSMVLEVSGEPKLRAWELFHLVLMKEPTSLQRRLLCRLPNRGAGEIMHLIHNDDRHLVVSWGNYVICVNKERLDQPVSPEG